MTDIERLNVISPRPRKNGQTFWLSVGTAFKSKDGSGYDVLLDAIPLPDDKGKCVNKCCRPHMDKGGQRGGQDDSSNTVLEARNDKTDF